MRSILRFSLILLLLFLFLSLYKSAYAYIPPDACGCNPSTDPGGQFCCYSQDCAGNQAWTNEPLSACQQNIGNPPSNVCDQSTFQFTYYICQTQMSQSSRFATCDYQYQFQEYQCSATDTCKKDGPYLYPGLCTASAYNGNDPSSACTTGSGKYKTCCYSNGTSDGTCVGGDHSGTCPSGTITKFCGFDGYPPCGTAACAVATPTPTPTPTSTVCPNSGQWTGQQCSPGSANIYQSCPTDKTQFTVAVCNLYDPATNTYCYQNNTSLCYSDPKICQQFGVCTTGGGVCTPGQTQTICDTKTCAVP